MNKNYYIIAGEASGDLHGAMLIERLKAQDKDAQIRFWGGDAMARAAGHNPVRHYADTAVMGFTEVIAKAGRIVGNLNFCKKDIAKANPDEVILIDYPGFNLKIARFAKRKGYKVTYYIPPKVWARGEHRIEQLKKYVDKVYIIFPFEKEYFKSHGIDAEYVRNPLIDKINSTPQETVGKGGKTIALFAGSRKAELKFLMPRLVQMEKLIRADERYKDYELIIAGAPSLKKSDYEKYLPRDNKIEIVFGKPYSLLRQSDAAIVCSGTASLEAAFCRTPQVVCYGFSKLTFALAKHLVKVKYISLANLTLDKLIFKELIQDAASPEAMKSELDRLVFDENVRETMQKDYDLMLKRF